MTKLAAITVSVALIAGLAGCSSRSQLGQVLGRKDDGASEKYTAASLLLDLRHKAQCEDYRLGADRTRWKIVEPLAVDRDQTKPIVFAAEQINAVAVRDARDARGRRPLVIPENLVMARAKIASSRGTEPAWCLFSLDQTDLRLLSRCRAGQERECLNLAYGSSG
ncbi:MAG: hypothetical protein OEM91_01965 [Hyphomicrobiales bacterium]|nr:hypothetical protein [Hyphomicrobiales bacterium]